MESHGPRSSQSTRRTRGRLIRVPVAALVLVATALTALAPSAAAANVCDPFAVSWNGQTTGDVLHAGEVHVYERDNTDSDLTYHLLAAGGRAGIQVFTMQAGNCVSHCGGGGDNVAEDLADAADINTTWCELPQGVTHWIRVRYQESHTGRIDYVLTVE